jgi:D-alanyl-D-alanine carboxypeptidase/D-alanyl-D-alanine-endopeptidase (penicillin-binding protein 4)
VPDAAERPLLVYRSPVLLHVVKALDGYSNNVFHYASDAIGGPHAVQAIARAAVPEAMRAEITIDNGAGAGTTNRLSPRAAVALLRALAGELGRQGHGLTDALPVSGVDPGTLAERLPDRPRVVVGKTGTFGSVGASALAGALRTRGHGTVYFAVLNHGVPVPAARARQDAFVRALADATDAEPWPYETAARPAYAEAEVE